MSFVIPGDPFTAALGKSITGATESATKGYLQRKDKEYNQQQQQAQIPEYANFLIDALDIDDKSPTADALRGANSIDTLFKMGDTLIKREEAPRREKQQTRLSVDSMNTEYNRAVKDINEGIRSGTIRDEKLARSYLQSLRKEQAANAKSIREGKPIKEDAFQAYIDVFSEKGKAGKTPPSQKNEKMEKPKFNSRNPDHIKLRDDALNRSAGNRDKANELLSEIFE